MVDTKSGKITDIDKGQHSFVSQPMKVTHHSTNFKKQKRLYINLFKDYEFYLSTILAVSFENITVSAILFHHCTLTLFT